MISPPTPSSIQFLYSGVSSAVVVTDKWQNKGLGTELTKRLVQIARHVEAPLDAGKANVLRPRIRRAARLANLWLTRSVQSSWAS